MWETIVTKEIKWKFIMKQNNSCGTDLKGCKWMKECKEKLYLRVMFGVTDRSRVKEIMKKLKIL